MDNDHEDLKAELTCPICMDLFREPRRLPCGHVYCRVCLQDMLTRKYLNTRFSERILSCPECRQRYDLTFQQAGVDVFPRDFKLVRLVELCEKKFTREGGGDRGAEAGTDEETAVKEVYTAESESSLQTTSAAATTASSSTSAGAAPTHEPATASYSSGHPLAWQQVEGASPHSFSSPANSLSDDSWMYVATEAQHPAPHRPAVPPALNTQWQERGDDSWLLPSAEGLRDQRFPQDSSLDVRGSTVVDYRTLPLSSGSYDNNSRENFHRFAAPVQQVPCTLQPPDGPRSQRTLPLTLLSSESSSGSESSDERGDEGSGEYDVSRSGSEEEGDDINTTNRRSRLSRFFRSLVMSESDSWDEEDLAGGLHPESRAAHVEQPHQFERGHGEQQLPHCGCGDRTAAPSARVRVSEERVVGEMMPPESSYFENASIVEAGAHSSSADGHFRSVTEAEMGDPSGFGDTNHSSVGAGRTSGRHPGDVVADDGVVTGGAEGGARGGGGRGGLSRAVMGVRGRAAIEASDDSDEDYEPQTSMLRPKRKPRSRLKKFFTSLLSLSSSDEEDEVVEGDSQVASSTSASDRH